MSSESFRLSYEGRADDRYGSECYCGNIRPISVPLLYSQCGTYACTGNKAQACGGDWAMLTYMNMDGSNAASSSSSLSVSAASFSSSSLSASAAASSSSSLSRSAALSSSISASSAASLSSSISASAAASSSLSLSASASRYVYYHPRGHY